MKEIYYTTKKQLTSGSSLKLSHSSSFRAAKLAVVLSSISLSLLSLGIPSAVQHILKEKNFHFYHLMSQQKKKSSKYRYSIFTEIFLLY